MYFWVVCKTWVKNVVKQIGSTKSVQKKSVIGGIIYLQGCYIDAYPITWQNIKLNYSQQSIPMCPT
jgi:hypothetical protein